MKRAARRRRSPSEFHPRGEPRPQMSIARIPENPRTPSDETSKIQRSQTFPEAKSVESQTASDQSESDRDSSFREVEAARHVPSHFVPWKGTPDERRQRAERRKEVAGSQRRTWPSTNRRFAQLLGRDGRLIDPRSALGNRKRASSGAWRPHSGALHRSQAILHERTPSSRSIRLVTE